MDVAVIEAATGAVVTVVGLETLDGYNPGPGLLAVDATGEPAFAGCIWSADGGFVPPLVVPPTKDELIAYAADCRWRKEVGGITVAGVPVATDDRSKQMIIGARLAANSDPDWSTQWVGADGSIHPIDAAAIVAISDAVQAHVNDCFTTYALVKADIDAGTITGREQIGSAFAA